MKIKVNNEKHSKENSNSKSKLNESFVYFVCLFVQHGSIFVLIIVNSITPANQPAKQHESKDQEELPHQQSSV